MAKEKDDKPKTDEKLKGHDRIAAAVRSFEDLDKQAINISTGSLILDIFLGGGYSPGLSRFVGEPEHGKTLQALGWAKNWLDYFGDKGKAYYFDCEGRLTAKKIKLSGISKVKNLGSRFTVVRENCFDDIAAFIRDLMNDNADDMHYFFVFDSLDMLITKANLDKTMSEAEKVGAAQVMSTLLMKHVGVYLADRGHHLYICSQIRANINVNNPNSPKTKMSGANALRHAADIIGEIQKNFGGNEGMYIFENPTAASVKEKGNIIGHYHTIKFIKTMNEKSGHTIRIPIKRGAGIWHEREVADLAIAFAQVRKKGAWYQLKDEKEGWANTDWITRINTDLTALKRNRFVKEGVEKAIQEAAGKGDNLSKAKVKELTENLTKEAEKTITFEIETTWQGYDKFFSYIENNADLVDWMDKEFRNTLISDTVAFSVSERDDTFE